jgi:hypothetical protein
MRTRKEFYFYQPTRTGGYVVSVHNGDSWIQVNPMFLVTEEQAECMRKELRKHNYPEVDAKITLQAMCKHCVKIDTNK